MGEAAREENLNLFPTCCPPTQTTPDSFPENLNARKPNFKFPLGRKDDLEWGNGEQAEVKYPLFSASSVILIIPQDTTVLISNRTLRYFIWHIYIGRFQEAVSPLPMGAHRTSSGRMHTLFTNG